MVWYEKRYRPATNALNELRKEDWGKIWYGEKDIEGHTGEGSCRLLFGCCFNFGLKEDILGKRREDSKVDWKFMGARSRIDDF